MQQRPLGTRLRAFGDYARHLDGLVLQGGADVSRSSYGEAPLRAEWAGDRLRAAGNPAWT